jgi:hypothetical protein
MPYYAEIGRFRILVACLTLGITLLPPKNAKNLNALGFLRCLGLILFSFVVIHGEYHTKHKLRIGQVIAWDNTFGLGAFPVQGTSLGCPHGEPLTLGTPTSSGVIIQLPLLLAEPTKTRTRSAEHICTAELLN